MVDEEDVDGMGRDEAALSPQRDCIFVQGLVLPVAIGVYDEEQGVTQKVSFTVRAELALCVRAVEDDLRLVPSYDDIVKAIHTIVAGGHIKLAETLAERVAAACLNDRRIARVHVRIEKLERGPQAVGVEIARSRP